LDIGSKRKIGINVDKVSDHRKSILKKMKVATLTHLIKNVPMASQVRRRRTGTCIFTVAANNLLGWKGGGRTIEIWALDRPIKEITQLNIKSSS
jgi:hypothetical protein